MDKKTHRNPNIVEPLYRKFSEIIIPKLPKQINSFNLTLISLLWSSLILIGGFLSKKNVNWLYLIILAVFLHSITDFLDGKVGRYRKTGAIKWGYYMDHIMDLLMISCVFFSLFYFINSKDISKSFIIIIIYINVVITMVSSFLSLNKNGLNISFVCYKKYCCGPNDGLLFTILYILYIIFTNGNPSMSSLIIISLIFIGANINKIYRNQKHLFQEDMKKKNNSNL